jgi:RHS repeat-associated protein
VQKRPSGVWLDEQSTERSYFENGLLKQLTSKDGAGTVIEQHTLDYVTGGVYVNGNRVKDVFKLVGPDAAAPCRTATCTATWTYDPRERVTQEVTGTGETRDYTLDTIGNVTSQNLNGSLERSATFSGQQMLSEHVASTTRRFIYDVLGNQDCVTRDTYTGAACPSGGSDLLEDNIYDHKSRLVSFRKYSGGALDRKTDYTIDPLDRPVKLAEWNGATTTTTDLVYVGISDAVAKETLTGGTPTTKTYAYDPLGRRATLTEGTHRYSYLNDPHGSVSMLIDQSNTVKAAYGYNGYGNANSSLTKLGSGFAADTNLYRYSGKRYDTNSDSYDMGARRYSAGRGRFIQRDFYADAVGNLDLADDPLTDNRYALAAGNPVSFVEMDGHKVVPIQYSDAVPHSLAERIQESVAAASANYGYKCEGSYCRSGWVRLGILVGGVLGAGFVYALPELAAVAAGRVTGPAARAVIGKFLKETLGEAGDLVKLLRAAVKGDKLKPGDRKAALKLLRDRMQRAMTEAGMENVGTKGAKQVLNYAVTVIRKFIFGK